MSAAGDRLLFLGPEQSPLLGWLADQEPDLAQTSEKISADYLQRNKIGFAVSYGYRHILRGPVLERLPDRLINLHISMLPWNRGADPNLWSFAENTPKGVSIHYIDSGVDTGDLIARRTVRFQSEGETLATTYKTLQQDIQALFQEHWNAMRAGRCERAAQPKGGSTHRLRDKDPLLHLLTDGWGTPVSVLMDYAASRSR